MVVILGCASASLVFQAACGGGGSSTVSRSNVTPPGTYTVTVVGTAGATQRSTRVTLTVQ
jgi:hypothetical protein